MPIWLVALTSNEIEGKNQIEDLKSQISNDFSKSIKKRSKTIMVVLVVFGSCDRFPSPLRP